MSYVGTQRGWLTCECLVSLATSSKRGIKYKKRKKVLACWILLAKKVYPQSDTDIIDLRKGPPFQFYTGKRGQELAQGRLERVVLNQFSQMRCSNPQILALATPRSLTVNV